MKVFSQSGIRLIAFGAMAGLMAACTTQSGPTYSAYSIQKPNQQNPTYRVTCNGLLESRDTCLAVADRICHDASAIQVENVDRLRSDKSARNPREITFTCGSPVVRQPVLTPAPVALPLPKPNPSSVPARQTLLQGDANFATDSAVLMPAAKLSLDQFLRANQNANIQRITIIGYTDSAGPASHNQKLSEARAGAAMQYLRGHGLRANEYSAEGRGAQQAVASNATAEGRAKNRRVEVQITAEPRVDMR